MSATLGVLQQGSPFWSIAVVPHRFGVAARWRRSPGRCTPSRRRTPTLRPLTPPPVAMCSRSLWENPAPSRRTRTRRR